MSFVVCSCPSASLGASRWRVVTVIFNIFRDSDWLVVQPRLANACRRFRLALGSELAAKFPSATIFLDGLVGLIKAEYVDHRVAHWHQWHTGTTERIVKLSEPRHGRLITRFLLQKWNGQSFKCKPRVFIQTHWWG